MVPNKLKGTSLLNAAYLLLLPGCHFTSAAWGQKYRITQNINPIKSPLEPLRGRMGTHPRNKSSAKSL